MTQTKQPPESPGRFSCLAECAQLLDHVKVLLNSLLSILSKKEIERPIFILGCGRSGTTILGTALSKHNSITYLNERRNIWFKAYPETDIWTHKASARNGKMCLTSEDINNVKSLKLRRLFHREVAKTSKPILVEKLPINNFRVEFIRSVFPDSKFIHIYRNGLEVARSIQKISENGGWFGSNDYKWKQLRNYSESISATAELPKLCDSHYYKGLLEWRLSTESAVHFLDTLPSNAYLEISYAAFSTKPIETIKQVLAYIGANDDSTVIDFVSNNISRRTGNLDNAQLTNIESKLGGELLPLSMDGSIGGLTNAYIQKKKMLT